MSKWSSAYRDSRWQKKRREIMERDEWTCQSCGASGEGVTLNVHHAYYEKGRAPWEYAAHVLVTQCEKCHEEIHRLQKKLLVAVLRVEEPISVMKQLIGYTDGTYGPSWNSGASYNAGYAAASLGINDVAAKAITEANCMSAGGNPEL